MERIVLISLFLLTITACGGRDDNSSIPPAQKTLASANISEGNNQTAVVGSELPITLSTVLLDNSNQPLAGQIVSLKVTAGNGTVFLGTATSDSNGVVNEKWTLGTTAGLQTLEVRALDASGNAKVFATFNATSVAGAPTRIELVPSIVVWETIQLQSLPMTVTLVDVYGNPIAGVSVVFTASGDSTVATVEAITDRFGQASTIWNLGRQIGYYSLTASTIAGLTITTTRNVIPAQSGDPRRITIVSGDSQTLTQHLPMPIPMQVLVTS